MNKVKLTLKIIFLILLAAAGMTAMLGLLAWMARPDLHAPLPGYTQAERDHAEAARDTSFDPENPPVLHLAVDYSEGVEGAWYPKGESPLLAELVAQGKLPPLPERIGPEPVVMDGVDGIGNYGGSWYRIANSDGDVGVMTWRIGGARLARWSPLGYPIKPHLAKSWEVSEDLREYTVRLRRGIRWSDGHPFTARDILYWWEHEILYFEGNPRQMLVLGQLGEIEKIDDHTVLFRFPLPHGQFPEVMAKESFWAPEHYLRPFHPELGDPERIDQMMRVQDAPSARTAYFRLKDFRNPELPAMEPWVMRAHQSSAPYAFVRNPYYPVVDAQGNQLPYIDRVVNDLRSEDMLAVTASAGDITMQMRHLRFEDHTLYMGNRETGQYDVYFWFRGERSNFVIFPNLNRRVDDDKPETAWKHQFLNKKEFRQALSLAINRRDIIRAEYDNIVEPAQLDPGVESPFHHPPLANAFIEYDPARANALLDKIGLTKRDSEGYRTFPDGSRMTFFLNITQFTGIGPSQFLIDDWRAVGVRVMTQLLSRNLWQTKQSALEHDLTVWTGESEFLPLTEPRNFVPTAGHSFYAPGFAYWYLFGGLDGSERVKNRPQAVEPPEDHPLRISMLLLRDAMAAGTLEEQQQAFSKILDIAAENLWSINIATPTPQLVVVKRGLKNVPRNAITGHIFNTPANAGVETYFFEEPTDSESAKRLIQRLMVEVDPDPRRTLQEVSATPMDTRSAGDRVGGILRFLFTGILIVGAVLVMVRHPFITRRVVILIPTVFIMSVCVFTIIELPPGDFITSRIQQLEMEGDTAAIQQAEELRQLFHLEESAALRYVRWIGLPWFISFDSADRGLIQGDLGRSMEDGQRVNEVVGDRIMLTLLISLFTLIFTWVVAIPIGLYSAVKQYSIGDYVFTFFGFIGMCVPPMLLALVMMYVGSTMLGLPVGGLFSPEYAMQPHWDTAKLLDLLQHIWIPVVVIGVAGTAGMIRVLRANMLDELGKPYVTTARAKGVRPFKLILKYPLRLALNPFISGIGMIFPQLVSGGAIVGIVLSLPTVGPLLLGALQAQNMYLAGSMLMVLSLLTVFGTLVSDLLLMWVDPRIRIGGKGGKS
ncbi:MAG: ABC transporter permease subunit [Verrucomicrobia bacterium]|nr:ABC transporter permease subunit [Verrucomicrobiota bacterium]